MDDTVSVAPATARREAQAFRSCVKADRSVWSQDGKAQHAPVSPTRGIISD